MTEKNLSFVQIPNCKDRRVSCVREKQGLRGTERNSNETETEAKPSGIRAQAQERRQKDTDSDSDNSRDNCQYKKKDRGTVRARNRAVANAITVRYQIQTDKYVACQYACLKDRVAEIETKTGMRSRGRDRGRDIGRHTRKKNLKQEHGQGQPRKGHINRDKYQEVGMVQWSTGTETEPEIWAWADAQVESAKTPERMKQKRNEGMRDLWKASKSRAPSFIMCGPWTGNLQCSMWRSSQTVCSRRPKAR
jgi:hypothetical protein